MLLQLFKKTKQKWKEIHAQQSSYKVNSIKSDNTTVLYVVMSTHLELEYLTANPLLFQFSQLYPSVKGLLDTGLLVNPGSSWLCVKVTLSKILNPGLPLMHQLECESVCMCEIR